MFMENKNTADVDFLFICIFRHPIQFPIKWEKISSVTQFDRKAQTPECEKLLREKLLSLVQGGSRLSHLYHRVTHKSRRRPQ